MSFFTELKRRNVSRVGVAYAVVAWLVLQVTDVVLNNVEAKIRSWINPDDPKQAPRKEFTQLPRLGRADDPSPWAGQVEKAAR